MLYACNNTGKLMNGAWETVVINCEHSIPGTPAFTKQLNMQFALKAWKETT